MSLPKCPIQDLCINYIAGSNLPPNHDVRDKVPCRDFLDMSCKLSVQIQVEAMGLTIACDIKHGRSNKTKERVGL